MSKSFHYSDFKQHIAVSFDDGPHPLHSPKLLDLLASHNIKAIFFVLGKKIATPRGKDILRRISGEGHFVGNHTYSHADLTKLKESAIRTELLKTAELIGDADRGMKLFRPPYGAHNQLVDHVVRELGYQPLYWNVDSLDWHPRFKHSDWLTGYLNQIRDLDHAVVLAHDVHPTTLPKIEKLVAAVTQNPGACLSLTPESLLAHLASVPPVWGTGPTPQSTVRFAIEDIYRAIVPMFWHRPRNLGG
jgi:peptidoglycan/xylan/chitin deacetylase (PgdA/CDA1 family)